MTRTAAQARLRRTTRRLFRALRRGRLSQVARAIEARWPGAALSAPALVDAADARASKSFVAGMKARKDAQALGAGGVDPATTHGRWVMREASRLNQLAANHLANAKAHAALVGAAS